MRTDRVIAVALVVLALDKIGEWSRLGWLALEQRRADRAYQRRVAAAALECCKQAKREAEELTDLLSHPETTVEQLQERVAATLHPLLQMVGAVQVPDDEAELRTMLWERVKAAQKHAYEHEQEDGLHGPE